MERPLLALIVVAPLFILAAGWIGARFLRGFLADQNAMMLGLAERLRPQAAVEQAQAAAIRANTDAATEAERKLDALEAERTEAIRSHIEEQNKAGYSGEVALARAAMAAAGADPDDADAVARWNQSN